MYCLDENVLIFILKNKIRLYHTYYKKNLVFSASFIDFVLQSRKGISKKFINKINNLKFNYFDATNFTLWDSLYNNPNFFMESNKINFHKIRGSELLLLLKEQRFLINNKTNYELNKTVEHYVSPTGGISRITVAVLVDGTYVEEEDEEGEKQKVYQSRSDEELNQIAGLVKSAVGYMEERGDVVDVENIQFDRRAFDEDMEYFEKAEARALWASVINKGLLLVSVLVALFVMKTLFKQTDKSDDVVLSLPGEDVPALEGLQEEEEEEEEELEKLEAGEGEEEELAEDIEAIEKLEEYIKDNDIKPSDGMKNWFSKYFKEATGEEVGDEIDEDIFIKKLSPEARAILKAKDKMTTAIIDFAKEAPLNASKLIHTWITKS